MIPFDTPLSVGEGALSLGPEIVRTALELQARGWQFVLADGTTVTTDSEPLLAGRLKTAMVDAVKELGVHAFIQEAVGTRSVEKPEKADGEADLAIWFFRSFTNNDPHLIIECKRVQENDARLIREYVAEGIDRFVKGKYLAGENGCFMTGFVISGSMTGVVAKLNAYLAKIGRPACQLQADADHADLGFVFVSNHEISGAKPVYNMRHTFLLLPGASA